LSAIRELAHVREFLQPATTFQVNIGTHQTYQIVAYMRMLERILLPLWLVVKESL
jgi:hypothetical protein